MLIEATKVVKPSNNFKYPWIGTVVYNQDPKKLRRVKCVIEGLMEGSHETLPWIMLDSDSGAGGTGEDGSFIVPKVGAKLNIYFPYDDLHFPVYRGYFQSPKTRPKAFDGTYPNEYGFQAGETKLVINRESNEVSIETANGVKISISSAGDIDIEGPTKINVKSPEINFNEKMSGITTENSHFGVVDLITGVKVLPSLTTFGDV